MNIASIFSERLKTLRTQEGLSQGQLGEKLNVSRGSISYYENQDRTPDITFLYSVANYFNTTTDYLLGISDVKDMNRGELSQQYEDVSRTDKIKIDKLISMLVQEIFAYSNTAIFTEFLALKDITIDSLIDLLKGFRVLRCSAIELIETKLSADKENIRHMDPFEVYELADPLKDVLRAMEISVAHTLNRYVYVPMSCAIDRSIKEILQMKLKENGGPENLSIAELHQIIFGNSAFDIIDMDEAIRITKNRGEANGEHSED